jgi:hypothetical protein
MPIVAVFSGFNETNSFRSSKQFSIIADALADVLTTCEVVITVCARIYASSTSASRSSAAPIGWGSSDAGAPLMSSTSSGQ